MAYSSYVSMAIMRRCTLGDLGLVVGGATPSTKVAENYVGGTIPWITPKDLSAFSGRYIYRGERNITELGLKSCSAQLMPKYSVLFSSRAPIGYVAIAGCEVCTNQGFKSVVPNDGTDYLFLYYLLKYKKNEIEAMGSGTTFREVSSATMKKIQVNVPSSVEEQRAIAGVLSSLDDKIEANNRLNDNLEQQGKSCIDDLYQNSDVSIPISQVMKFINGFAFKSSSYLSDGKYRIITIKNVKDGFIDTQIASCINDLPQKINQKCILNVGDILVSLTGNVGRVGIVCEENLLLNQRVAKIQAHDVRLHSLLYFFLRHPETKAKLENLARGTAQPNLSTSEALKIGIAFTPFIANPISDVVDLLFKQIIQRTRENMILSALRDSLLPKLMSGEIDVSQVQV